MSAKRRKTNVKMGDFLSLYRIEHTVEDDKTYRQVTISKKHGISFRGTKYGKNIGRKRQFILDLKKYPNTVMFTRQGVFDGAIGSAPSEVDKCIVTENMPMMSVDVDMIEISYLNKLLVSDYLHDKIQSLKIVGSAQKSIHERDLLNISITLPDKKTQKKICNKFGALDVEHSELEKEIACQKNLLKKIRQRILQEAIEGKLTAEWRQKNPDVEPASELLARIQAEKEQLVKDKKIKKQKPLPPISDDEKFFDLPSGWEFTSLANCSINKDEYRIPITKSDRSCREKIYDYYGASGVIDKIDDFTHKGRHLLIGEDGANLLSRTTPVAFLADGKFWVNNHAHVLATIDPITLDYLNVHINAINLNPYISGGFQPKLSQVNLNRIIVAFPPLPEQKAIVTKVEKLLALCDQMETQITVSQTHAKQLMQAVLKEAFSPNSEESLAG